MEYAVSLNPAGLPPVSAHFSKYFPGVAVAAGLVALAYGLRSLPGMNLLSPMILAIVLGIPDAILLVSIRAPV